MNKEKNGKTQSSSSTQRRRGQCRSITNPAAVKAADDDAALIIVPLLPSSTTIYKEPAHHAIPTTNSIKAELLTKTKAAIFQIQHHDNTTQGR